MKTFLIFYDLIKEEDSSDYEELKELIEDYPNWAKPCESTWFICTDETVASVRDSLKTALDVNDKLVVIDVTGSNWGSYNLPKNITSWMQTNI